MISWVVCLYRIGLPPQSAHPLAELDKLEISVLQVPDFPCGHFLLIGTLPINFRGPQLSYYRSGILTNAVPRPLARTFRLTWSGPGPSNSI